jgi:hypothetical protein
MEKTVWGRLCIVAGWLLHCRTEMENYPTANRELTQIITRLCIVAGWLLHCRTEMENYPTATRPCGWLLRYAGELLAAPVPPWPSVRAVEITLSREQQPARLTWWNSKPSARTAGGSQGGIRGIRSRSGSHGGVRSLLAAVAAPLTLVCQVARVAAVARRVAVRDAGGHAAINNAALWRRARALLRGACWAAPLADVIRAQRGQKRL